MAKMILLKPHEADTIIKYLDLIDQEVIDKRKKKWTDVYYSVGEMEKVKKSILEEI